MDQKLNMGKMKMEEKKLTNSFKSMISGQSIFCRYNYKKESTFEDSPLRNAIKINLGEKSDNNKKCFKCDILSFDYCTNCDCPMCESHAYVIIKNNMILLICGDCKELIVDAIIEQQQLNEEEAQKLKKHYEVK